MAKRKKTPKDDPIARLKAWAVAGGAENEALTNRYELVRLRVNGGVAIVFRKENGSQTWNGLAIRLRDAMNKLQPFPGALQLVAKVKHKTTRHDLTHRTLIERDGLGCFFCGHEVEGDMTIEELVPRAHGGPRHISNRFRACSPCNMHAGHKSAPEKIRIRETRLFPAYLTPRLIANHAEEHF